MKFDRYMHESMQEMTQNISPDPMLRARVMNAVQADRTKTRPRRMRFVLAAAAMVCVLVTGAFAAGPIAILGQMVQQNLYLMKQSWKNRPDFPSACRNLWAVQPSTAWR